jgi:hypothetical protein
VVKCFNTSTPGIWNSEMESNQRFGVSSFCISAIRHFDTTVVKCFDTSTPSIRNSEMESDQRSDIFSFRILVIQHFDTPDDEESRLFQLPVSEIVLLSRFRRFAFRDSRIPNDEESRLFQLPISETISCFQDFSVSHFAIPRILMMKSQILPTLSI